MKFMNFLHYFPDFPLFLVVYAFMFQNTVVHQYIYSRYSEDLGFNYNYDDDSSTCGGNLANKTDVDAQKKVQQLSARFNIIQILALTVPTVITSLYYGSLSDNIGRKPIFIVCVTTGILDAVVTLLTILFDLPIWLLYVGSFLSGLGGGYTGLGMVILAFIADITVAERMPVRLAIVNSSIIFGLMFSHYTGGPFIRHAGFKAPEIVVLIIRCLSLIWIVTIIRESLGKLKEAKETSEQEAKSKLSILKELPKQPLIMWRTFVKPREKRSHLYLAFLVTIFDFCFTVGVFSVVQLYFMNSPFCWPPHQIGIYDGTTYLVVALGTTIGVKVGLKCFSESAASLISTAITTGFYLSLIMSKTTQLVYAGLALKAWTNLAAPIFKAIVSRLVEPDERGAVFALISAFQMLLVFAANFVFNASYTYFNLKGHVGLFWFVPAGSTFIPITFICIYWYLQRGNKQELVITKSFKNLYQNQMSTESTLTVNTCLDEPLKEP